MHKLFKKLLCTRFPKHTLSFFASMFFAKCHKIKTEWIVWLFKWYKISQKINNSRKCIVSSCITKYTRIQTLNSDTSPYFQKFFPCFVTCFYKSQNFFLGMWIEFYCQFFEVFQAKKRIDCLNKIDEMRCSDCRGCSSSDMNCSDIFII